MKPNSKDDRVQFFCDRCGAELRPGSGNFYLVKIEAVADPTPPFISAEDLPDNIHEEIERLIAQTQGLSEQEAMDLVYRRLNLYLCSPCYQRWIENPAG